MFEKWSGNSLIALRVVREAGRLAIAFAVPAVSVAIAFANATLVRAIVITNGAISFLKRSIQLALMKLNQRFI